MVERFKLLCVALLLLVLCPAQLMAASTVRNVVSKQELRIGLNPGFMPFEMEDNRGTVIGFDVDLSRELAKAMGVKFVLVAADFDTLIRALDEGKVDLVISGLTITQKRNLEINFSDPYISIGQTVIINSRHQSRVSSWEKLNDSRFVIGCLKNSPGEEAVRRLLPKARVSLFDKELDGAMEVINGRVDAWVFDLPFNVMFQAQHGKSSTVHLLEPLTYAPLGIGVRQGDVDMLNFVNHFLRQIQNDGRYQQIFDKWIRSTDWLPQLKPVVKAVE